MFQVKVKSQTEVTGSKLFKVKHFFNFFNRNVFDLA